MPLTPFDVTKYRNAQPVITRDGRSINNLKEVYYSELGDTYLTALVDLKPVLWDLNGKKDFIYGTTDALDLFMGPVITYYWALTADLLDTDPSDTSYSQVFVTEPL